MALIRWKCSKCGVRRRALIGSSDRSDLLCEMPCPTPECEGRVMERETGVSTSVVETRDNGVMPRAVERYRDAEELRHDHAQLQDKKEPGMV